MTVHNRKDITIKCLSNLNNQEGIEGLRIDVFLTDDGSTDGTAELIKETFPSVNIIKGDGSLFWNRGMYVAWKEAALNDYDYYLWLNDDTMLYKDALENLLRVENEVGGRSIVVGSICSKYNPEIVTYGGRSNGKLIHPRGEIKSVKEINGNVVLIPREVFNSIGYNDPYYHHSSGDVDYGLMAVENGFVNYITDVFVGSCERHDNSRKCWNPQYGVITRFKYLYSPLGYPPNEEFHFYRKHSNLCKAFWMSIRCQLKTLFPYIKLNKNK